MAKIDDLLDDTEEHMMAAVEVMEKDFMALRTGKASPGLVEQIEVDCYGTKTRLREIAGITTPEPRLLVVQPWDKNIIGEIEKAIAASDIGITPVNDGRVIRLPVPELSEERRADLAKRVRKRAEETKVTIRNHRRDANDAAKQAQKSSDITEDGLRDLTEDIQKLTDEYTKQIDTVTQHKEAEVMEV